jgi:hypothetical protein
MAASKATAHQAGENRPRRVRNQEMFRRQDTFVSLLRRHFGAEPASLVSVEQSFDKYEHANVHLGIEGYINADQRKASIHGVANYDSFGGLRFAALLETSPNALGKMVCEGPVQYANVDLGDDKVLTCVHTGLYLVHDQREPLAVLVDVVDRFDKKVRVEVVGRTRKTAESLLRELGQAVRKQAAFRGHIISLSEPSFNCLDVHYHALPKIAREQIILPPGLLERIERHTVRFSQLTEQLLKARRHLKRGLLLHGNPGTGKTLTGMYLAGQMPNRTVLLLTGQSLALIEKTCQIARMLQPSLVIFEDVDLVAEKRDQLQPNPLLFVLLNAMDGLNDDADVLFLLTTNRPEALETALASRPGRIDQAFEFPLPDRLCRRRLFEWYGHGLDLRLENLEHFINRTEGASAAFIRELLRKATLFAADESSEVTLEDRHLEEALQELSIGKSELTRRLLGFKTTP